MSAPSQAATSAQLAQEGLGVVVASDLARAFTTLDVSHLRASLPDFAALVAGIVHRYGLASAAIAARQYADQRAAAVGSRFTVIPASPAEVQAVGRMVSWATQPLWATSPALEAAQRNLVAGAEKLVLDAGRRTIIDNVKRDPKAHGWARLTEAKPCAFCALLATRGAVYKESTADFRSHDHCRCHAEPTFGPYEPPAQVREWQQLYQNATTAGNSAKTRREWRSAFDAAYPS